MLKLQVVRFAFIGLLNSVVDIAIFLFLRSRGLSVLPANICSTSVALGISFSLNHKYTFDAPGRRTRIVPFLAVTLLGLWVIQPIVIKSAILLDATLNYTHYFENLIFHKIELDNLLPKLFSICVTMIWNFLWYKKVVFKNTVVKGDD